jgi:hypothetical protein
MDGHRSLWDCSSGHRNVPTANLEFLGKGLFGPARDKNEHHARWTGDAYKLGVYAHVSRYNRLNVLIFRTEAGFIAI